MKVLLIDDDPFMLKLLSRQLAQLGHVDIVPCQRAQDAVALLQEAQASFGLVLCDLQMPEMDGVEFVRHLAGIGFAGAVLIVTGEENRVAQTVIRLARAQRLNVLGALAKPVSIDALKGMLQGHRPPESVLEAPRRNALSAHDLRDAIRGRQLVTHYQPKVDLTDDRIIGVEALVRWHHPIHGLLYPDQFVHIAEQHGLIDELTREVLRLSVDQAVAWRRQDVTLQLAVNVSMDNLTALEFPDFVARLLHDAGLAASSLRLEVTESRLMQDPVRPLDVLTRLRLKGITLSIDDFGTGHSSLAQLRDIPFGELKIDRSFVHGGAEDPSLRAIVRASIGMARQLGMTSVAEGVEDLSDWNFAREAGCTQAQGYYIARPMAGELLPAWIEQWRARRQASDTAA